MFIFYVILFIR